MKLSTRLRLQALAVWAARIITGFTFIISGWAKAIDPWGFIIKVGEYLAVWGLNVPEEAIITGCSSLAIIEFATGAMIATGCLRRVAVWCAAAMMAFMLPLTLYIWIASPVSDCGCFGDFMIISNAATFIKNVFIYAIVVYLLFRNRTVRGIYIPAMQWLVIAASLVFPLYLAFIGYQVQPLVDFRPYKTGTPVFTDVSRTDEPDMYLYERNGITKEFPLDQLPDSTWTYVGEATATDAALGGDIAIRDADGYDCAADFYESESPALLLIVPEPDVHYLSFAHYVNRLYESTKYNNVDFAAILGAEGAELRRWIDWCRPSFNVYTADPSSLKQFVRGKESVVYVNNGRIIWKRTLGSLSTVMPEGITADSLDNLAVPDNGTWHAIALGMYLAFIVLVYLLGLSPAIVRFFVSLFRRI